jgi:V8-like Glu-specific endopeptidase
LLATPVLLIATVMLLGVTAGSAGPSTTNATAQGASGAVTHTTAYGAGTQSLNQLLDYWTPTRMAEAQPKDMAVSSTPAKAEGSFETIPATSAGLRSARMNADGSVTEAAVAPQGSQSVTEPFHSDPPFDRWQYFARYDPNSPGGGTNLAASVQAKMFFTQGTSNFVCSASTIGQDAVWTAGHCVSTGTGSFSTNVLFCPSHDNGAPLPGVGCWAAESLVVSAVFHTTGQFDYDLGAADVADTGTVHNTLIGNRTGWLGIAYVPVVEGTTESFNAHFTAWGYPQAAPFNGQKIHVCAAPFAYTDPHVGGGQDSKSIGCDMTGGSSGGPWIIGLSRHPNQIGGLPGPPSNAGLQNSVFGHNDWRHTAEPGEMNSPPYNCLTIVIWRIANDVAPAACP